MQEYVLENRGFRLTIDHKGNLYQLESPLLNNEGIFRAGVEKKPAFFWSIELADEEIAQERMATTPPLIEENSAKFFGQYRDVQVELSIVVDELGPRWVMNIANHGPDTLTNVEFTLIGQLSFGPDLLCTIPYCAGWALPLNHLAPEEKFCLDYPVKASMQWISVYSHDRGVYFGIHDPIPLYKELIIENSTIRWKFPHANLLPGENLTLPAVYLIPHSNDWRGGTEYYRAWAQQHVKTPDTPDWYARKPTWAWVGLRGQHLETSWHDTTYLPDISEFVARAGVNLIQLTAYTEQGHDTLYPDYEPGDTMGGSEGLRQAVDAIHQAGRQISIYTNGRLIDPASTVSVQDRQLWGVRAAPGADVFKEQYGDVIFDVMCPGAPGWRELFIEKLEYLVKEFDIDGIYIDQVSGCRSLPCYSLNHDHGRPNEAWSYYRKFMRELRARLTALKPGIFLSTEGVNDLLGQYFDSQQAHNDWTTLTGDRGIPLPDLFHTTFPGQLLNVGCITQEESGPHYLKLAHLSGAGSDFGVWDWKVLPKSFLETARGVLEWYAEHADTFRFGKIVSLDGDQDLHEWKVNAFYMPPSIVVNGACFMGGPESKQPLKCSVHVPLPVGSIVHRVSIMEGFSTAFCRWSMGDDVLNVQFDGGGGDLAGVAVELKKRTN